MQGCLVEVVGPVEPAVLLEGVHVSHVQFAVVMGLGYQTDRIVAIRQRYIDTLQQIISISS
jgi:hypothetical protein